MDAGKRIQNLERELDSFNPALRRQALEQLWQEAQNGQISLPSAGTDVNLHCHSFFSYNAYGYSPSKFAWLARKKGLAVAGIVDFDVLDGLNEFIAAAELLQLKGCVGMETRVYVPEFSDKEITSPGEPGITYHMGVGFPTADLQGAAANFLQSLRDTAQHRNRELTERVNRYLSPVELDYEQDVLPLTPSGNATERHICLAFAQKAQKVFADGGELARFWAEKLSVEADSLDLPEGPRLQELIRARMMKRGGVGYIPPDAGSFPRMDETNEFILAAGGIPTLTWLNGFSKGEQDIEQLLDVAVSTGVAAINIIPDRNYTPGIKNQKLSNLYHVVEVAERRHLPVVVGTEMNSPGQKFVDDFKTAELLPLMPVFLRGADIIYAHFILQRRAALGYTSKWAGKNFENVGKKNDFFEKIGKNLQPDRENLVNIVHNNDKPRHILDKIKGI